MKNFFTEIDGITMTFNDIGKTEDGMEYIRIYFEKPVEDGFCFLESSLPLLNVVETEGFCPECGNKMISKKSKRGFTFYGCSNYPECKFMTWDMPTKEVCPKGGKSLFKARGGVYKCLDANCGYEQKGKKKKAEDDE